MIISPLDNNLKSGQFCFSGKDTPQKFQTAAGTGLIYLDKSIEDIKKNMALRWRRQIKNGKKLNYKIRISNNTEDIHELINLYKEEKKNMKV